MSRRRRTSVRTNWKNGQPLETLEQRVVPAAVAVSFGGGVLTLTSTPGSADNEVVTVKAGAAFTDILVNGKLQTRLAGTNFDGITQIDFNAQGGDRDSLNIVGITSNDLNINLTSVEKLQLNTGNALSDNVDVDAGGSALILVTSNVNGTLNVTDVGAVTQSGKLIVSGATTITTNGPADITLKTSGNSFGTLNLTGADITINEAGPTDLGASTTNASGLLKVTSTGTISGTGLVVGGVTTLTSNGASITVDGDFGDRLILKGTTVTVTDTDGDTELGKTTATTSLSVTSAGAITDVGNITVGGLATFDATDDILLNNSNNFGSLDLDGDNVTVVEKSATNLVSVVATGNLMVTSSGAITDSGTIDVDGNTTLNAKTNAITLDTTDSTFEGTIVLTGGNVTITDDDGATVLGAVTAKGNLNVTTTGNTADPSTDTITQTGTLTVTGRFTLTATDALITLETAANKFGSISLFGRNASIREADGTDIFDTTIDSATAGEGNFTLQSGGAVTDSGTIMVSDTTFIHAGPTALGTVGATSKSITLDEDASEFTGAITLEGANASLINAAASTTLDTILLTSSFTLQSAGDVTQADGNDADAATAMTVPGRLTIDASGSNISLGGTDVTGDGITANFGSISVSNTNNVVIREDSDSDLFTSEIGGTFELDSAGAVTDSGDVDVDGTTNIDATTSITLNSTESDYVGAVSLNGTNISFFNNSTTVIGVVMNQDAGGVFTLSLTSEGDITDNGTGTITSDTGLITFNAGGDISITNAASLLDGAVSLFGSDVTLTTGGTTSDLTLATSTIRDDLNLTVAGNLTQSGTIKVQDDDTSTSIANTATTNGATINTGADDITLNNFPNEFSELRLTGDVVDINESGDTDLATSTVGSLKITSTGDISDTGILTVAGLAEMIASAGALTFDSADNDFGMLRLNIRDDINVTENDDGATAGTGDDAGGTVLDGVTTQGNFTLNAAGAVTKSAAAVVVLGDVVIVADFNGAGTAGGEQNITLDGTGNIFGDTGSDGITFTGADVTLFEINPTVLSPNLAAPSTATGSLTIRSVGSITANGEVNAGATTLIAGDTDLDGDSDSTEVISLANAANDFGTLTLQGGAATIHDNTSGTTLAASSVSSLTLTSVGGDVTQTGNLVVTNLLTITTAGDVDLTTAAGNSFGSFSITADDASITESNSSAIAFLNIADDFTLNTTGDFTLNTTGDVTGKTADITVGGDFTINATGSVTIDPTVGGTLTITAGGNVLFEATGDLTARFIVTGDVLVRMLENGNFTLVDNAPSTLGGSFEIQTTGTVTLDIIGSGSSFAETPVTNSTSVVFVVPTGTFTFNNVTADDVVNIAESGGMVAITGSVTTGGTTGVEVGDTITLTLVSGGNVTSTFTGTVQAGGVFSIDVAGSALVSDADSTIAARITMPDYGLFAVVGSTSYAVDVVAPTVTLMTSDTLSSDDITGGVLGDGSDPAGQDVTITIAFSEAVTGFTFDDIDVGGNVTFDAPEAADLTTGDDITFTFVVHVTAGTAGQTLTIDVGAGVADDDVGNDNTAATQLVLEVDPE